MNRAKSYYNRAEQMVKVTLLCYYSVMVLKLLILGVVVGFNNTATSIGLGALGQRKRIWRIVAVFGLLEFAMPLIGMGLRRGAAKVLEDWAGAISPYMLAAIAALTLVSAYRGRSEAKGMAKRITSLKGLIPGRLVSFRANLATRTL